MRCSYGLCNSDWRYKHKEEMKGVIFLPFPNPDYNLARCRKWVNACGRKYFTVKNVTKNSYICTKHFVGGKGPTEEHPDPIPEKKEIISSRKRKRPFSERANENRCVAEIPSSVASTSTNDDLRLSRPWRQNPIYKTREESAPSCSYEEQPYASMEEIPTLGNEETYDNIDESPTLGNEETYYISTEEIPTLDNEETYYNSTEEIPTLDNEETFDSTEEIAENEQGQSDKCTQTVNERYLNQLIDNICNRRSALDTESTTYKISFEVLSRDEDQFKFFSGFAPTDFMILFKVLGEDRMLHLKVEPGKPTPIKNYKQFLTIKDKLLLTLVRLRRGFTYQELSYFFRISRTSVSKIVYCFIQFMYFEFLKYKKPMFISRYAQKRKLSCFKAKAFKNVRVIVDCTEVEIQMPKNFKEQGNTYSNYKHRNTIKFLVGISTAAAIMYISDGYEGSQTDEAIFEDMISYLVPGDVVMADRGFNVQHKLDVVKSTLLIPPFLRGRAKLSAEEEVLTKQIAKARIHVERANKRIKDYKIFSRVIPNKLLPIVSQMFYVVCCLVNFERSEVIEDD